MERNIERVPTYIKGFDQGIEGGIPKGFVNLICGFAGTMKSSIIFNIIYNEAMLKGKNSLYVSLEQSFENFSMQLSSLGIDISNINIALADVTSAKFEYLDKQKKDTGTIIFLDIFSTREKVIQTRKYEGELFTFLRDTISKAEKNLKFEYFVMDGLNALYAISEVKKARETLFNIFQFLRDKGLTSYLILEANVEDRDYGIENYLADSVIEVNLARYDRVVQREIVIKKMRATKANINVFTLEVEDGQFKATHGGKIPVIDFSEQEG